MRDEHTTVWPRLAAAVGVAVALIVAFLVLVPRLSEPPSTAAPAEPSTTAVEEPPAPQIPAEVMEASQEQEMIAVAHPDVFSAYGFSPDNSTAVLYYAQGQEVRARELAAPLERFGELSVLEPRRHSWNDLKAQRRAVRTILEREAMTVHEVVPDILGADAVVLVVQERQVNDDGSFGSPGLWRKLQAAGVAKVVGADEPAHRLIHGLPVVGLDAVDDWAARGYFSGLDISGGMSLPANSIYAVSGPVGAVASAHEDLFAGVAIGSFGDLVKAYVVAERLDEARDLIVATGVDMSMVELIGVPEGQEQLHARVMPVMDKAEDVGLEVSAAAPDWLRGGINLSLTDLDDLAELSDAQVEELTSLGLVAVSEMPMPEAMGLFDPED